MKDFYQITKRLFAAGVIASFAFACSLTAQTLTPLGQGISSPNTNATFESTPTIKGWDGPEQGVVLGTNNNARSSLLQSNSMGHVHTGMLPTRQTNHISPPPVTPNHNGRPFGTNASALLATRLRRESVFESARTNMIANQLGASGRFRAKEEVVNAMKNVPREDFIPAIKLSEAYADKAVDIGFGRNTESPYQVAMVADLLDAKPNDRILELGTGSGYQSAVLSHLVQEVDSVESSTNLAEGAKVDVARAGCTNVFVRQGDLIKGWPERTEPFDAIVVNTGPGQVSDAVLSQLKEGGRVILPVAEDGNIQVMQKTGGQLRMLNRRLVRPQAISGNAVKTEPVRKLETREQ